MSNSNLAKKFATAALAGLLAAGTLTACETTGDKSGKEANGCKGKSGCKGGSSCKDKGSCKSKGSCS